MNVSLPKPEQAYNYGNEVETRRQIEDAFLNAVDKRETITLQPGQRISVTADGSLILTSPNGTLYAVVVDNAGVLSTTPA